MVELINAYSNHQWQPTVWLLMATYALSENNQITNTFSLRVRRHLGKVTVTSGAPELIDAAGDAISNLNIDQTDERFLQNLAYLLPAQIDELTQMELSVFEVLATDC